MLCFHHFNLDQQKTNRKSFWWTSKFDCLLILLKCQYSERSIVWKWIIFLWLLYRWILCSIHRERQQSYSSLIAYVHYCLSTVLSLAALSPALSSIVLQTFEFFTSQPNFCVPALPMQWGLKLVTRSVMHMNICQLITSFCTLSRFVCVRHTWSSFAIPRQMFHRIANNTNGFVIASKSHQFHCMRFLKSRTGLFKQTQRKSLAPVEDVEGVHRGFKDLFKPFCFTILVRWSYCLWSIFV